MWAGVGGQMFCPAQSHAYWKALRLGHPSLAPAARGWGAGVMLAPAARGWGAGVMLCCAVVLEKL
jgi:hypothetical protein